MNVLRRHLTIAQRAALALDLLPKLEEEARERQSLAGGSDPGPLPPETEEARGEATEKAAALVGVGHSTVANAKAIAKDDPAREGLPPILRRAGAGAPVSHRRRVSRAPR